MTVKNNVSYLSELQLFQNLSDEQQSILAKKFKFKQFKKNDIVINRNEIQKELFFVISGKIISTLKLPNMIERQHGEYLPGDFFGEIYLGGNKPLYDSYMADENSKLLTIHENELMELIEDNPQCFIPFVTNLLSRIIIQFRKSSKFLADVVQWGEQASRRVITDDLTGIYNRSFLDDALENFFFMSKSNNKSLSFLMLDIDNYRVVNNELGIETGNKLLGKIVAIIQDSIKQIGILARYGGDEFSILLPEKDLDNALKIAENIRGRVENSDFSQLLKGSNISITTSIGVSSYPETAGDLEQFKKMADTSLYKAKENGRNRVEYIK